MVYWNHVLDEWLSVTMTGPDGEERSLSGTNSERRWERGPAGHARTEEKETRLWHPVTLPARFELDVELVSSASPRG